VPAHHAGQEELLLQPTTEKLDPLLGQTMLSEGNENGGKMAEMLPRFRHGLCGQQHGLAMNWVDQPSTSADERDVVCSPRCRDCVWAVQGLVVFLIDLSFLREQST